MDDKSYYNFILIKDIERCPYVPKDLEYEEWNKRNEQRLRQIAIARGWKPTRTKEKGNVKET